MKIYPLKVKELSKFTDENASPEKKFEMAKQLIKKSLNDPTVTDEEIDNMDASIFIKIMNVINKINGFEDANIAGITRKPITKR